MNNKVDELSAGLARKKRLAADLVKNKKSIRALAGIPWDRFNREIHHVPLPFKIDHYVAVEIHDLINTPEMIAAVQGKK